MVIANATGCSMIWGSMYPSNPYAVVPETGRGPAYGHSLFEDAAEYGWGVVNSIENRRKILIDKSKRLVATLEDGELKKALDNFTKHHKNADKCEVVFNTVSKEINELPEEHFDNMNMRYVRDNVDLFTRSSYWFIGGDGWAYDIGSAGLDHCLA